MVRLRVCVSVLVVMLVLVAGCSRGDGSAAPVVAAAFTSELAATQSGYEQALREVQQRGQAALASGGDAVLAVYREMLTVTRTAHRDYARLDAPEAVHDNHERLVELLERQAAVLERVLAAASAQDDAALTEALQELAVVIGDWATANAALDRVLTSAA